MRVLSTFSTLVRFPAESWDPFPFPPTRPLLSPLLVRTQTLKSTRKAEQHGQTGSWENQARKPPRTWGWAVTWASVCPARGSSGATLPFVWVLLLFPVCSFRYWVSLISWFVSPLCLQKDGYSGFNTHSPFVVSMLIFMTCFFFWQWFHFHLETSLVISSGFKSSSCSWKAPSPTQFLFLKYHVCHAYI